MKSAVVFYSLYGSTKIAAQAIAQKKGAALYELSELRGKRTGIFGFIKSGFQAVTKKKTKLADYFTDEITACGAIYIGTPIWGGMPAPAVNSFIHHNDFSGKDVYIFTLQSDPEVENMSKKAFSYLLSLIEAKGGRVKGLFPLLGSSNEAPNADSIMEQVSKKVI
ncbi:MAG: hypothetical protein Q8O09_05930 [Bacillota bacterium]|nr:hypothetical protein [Bacillota bacterium]